MPRIFDNIDLKFLPALGEMLHTSTRSDFCVGYFNLRGWRELGEVVEERYSGEAGSACRVLVGMHSIPDQDVRAAYSLVRPDEMDMAAAVKLKRQMAENFRQQLTIGAPTEFDEYNLRRLAQQLRKGKVVIKLFLRNTLHAKLYLVHRQDVAAPIVGYVGSSNLTFAGLMQQFELNVDVVEGDAATKLAKWFEDRWNDRWCLDISKELAEIIDESWARPVPIPPYHIYIKMAYHLSQEARAGLSEFRIPKDFGNKLFEYQVAAVKIAAHHLNDDKRRGVILGDVVGLGKTLMATALARIFEDDHDLETLIICPKNLVPMWEDYREQYRMRARVLSITRVAKDLPTLRRYRLIILDESHNLRNREGQRYKAIQDYIAQNESRCILLSATPYNKAYLDLGAQLRLFVPETLDLGVRPDTYIKQLGEARFQALHQCPLRSISAFEKSPHADDWRELMRLFMVRRTRGFIKENYAEPRRGEGRNHLVLADGSKSFFPDRIPKTVKFELDESKTSDPYARLLNESVVALINSLDLPRYGLGNYVSSDPGHPPTNAEVAVLRDLGRAGKRLMGFCRTNLFKRLESSGIAFLQSVERHVLRNHIFLHAIEHGLPIPIGTTDPAMLDSAVFDDDIDSTSVVGSIFDEDVDDEPETANNVRRPLADYDEYQRRAAEIYGLYETKFKRRFRWLRPQLFTADLAQHLTEDCTRLCGILKQEGEWNSNLDSKLGALTELLSVTHAREKIIVFTQYADSVRYLTGELKRRGIKRLEGVTGQSADPTRTAWRFSPESNGKRDQVKPQDELRVIIATDVLSEGQNLQDAHVVINFDMPWAIIRLIQRAGRVDRIGQKHDQIYCYTFLPMDGVERIIKLRGRVRQRLRENAEVVGADETFFEDEVLAKEFRDLYNEKAGILDGDGEGEVDLASLAYQIWKNATDDDSKLRAQIEALPDLTYTAKSHEATPQAPQGALVYMRTAQGSDALAWVDSQGKSVTESQFAILRAAECKPDAPAVKKLLNHHEIVKMGVERMMEEESQLGGQLGKPSGARYRTYERLKRYAEEHRNTLLDIPELHRAIEDIYRFPLLQSATDTLNRQIKSGVADAQLVELILALRGDNRLCILDEEPGSHEPRIICSLGLADG
jgi:superfamily II DNA or RNA helicase